MWFQTRVAQKLGIHYPIIQGAFGSGLSSPRLTAAVSNAGGLGSYGAHHLEAPQIREMFAEIRTMTQKSFAVNLWVPLPGETAVQVSDTELAAAISKLTPYYQAYGLSQPERPQSFFIDFEKQLETLIDLKPPVISFIFGAPSSELVREIRTRGIVTMATATHVEEALELEARGIDVIVASGSEAGGHRASFLSRPEDSPATAALVPQTVDRVKAPVIAAGGIADGRGIVSAFALGAEGAQIGTAFLVCEESNASAPHRAAIRASQGRSTALTRVFSGRLARGLRNQLMSELETDPRTLPYPMQNWLTQPIRKAAGAKGQFEHLALWSGQNAQLAKHTKASELFDFLVKDTERVASQIKLRFE